jgi:phosphorylase kinase alpha/beta subunit
LAAIQYWKDKDSGHWEEVRKVSASSIGVVVAGLGELKRLALSDHAAGILRPYVSVQTIAQLREKGASALRRILPAESLSPKKSARRYDAALLFLVWPLKVVDDEMATRIVDDVIGNLQGKYGIKRYLGDSFWSTNYKQIPPEMRTADYSDSMGDRDRLFVPGGEAHWCIFDPVISLYFGTRFQATGNRDFLRKQTVYFNRSLAQITGDDSPYGAFKCPELYYKERGRMETSEATPLLWTQANLWNAIGGMEKSLRIVEKARSPRNK